MALIGASLLWLAVAFRVPYTHTSTEENLLADNAPLCQAMISRFCEIAIEPDDAPTVRLHALLACGSANVGSSIDTIKIAEDFLADDVLFSPDQGQEHPGQLLSYLASSDLRERWLESPAGLERIWRLEQERCHGLSDVAWLIPAICLSGRAVPFVNQFGETISLEYLADSLVRQCNRPRQARPCYGFHDWYAAAIAATHWKDRISLKVLRRLEDARDGRLREALARLNESGDFDLLGYTQELNLPCPVDDESYYRFFGHLIEAFAVCPTDGAALDRVVSQVGSRCIGDDMWADSELLKSAGSRPGALYSALAHLIHEVRLYREKFNERKPAVSGG